MTEDDFKRLQNALTNKGRIDNEYYGCFGVGRLLIEIVTMAWRMPVPADEENYLGEDPCSWIRYMWR